MRKGLGSRAHAVLVAAQFSMSLELEIEAAGHDISLVGLSQLRFRDGAEEERTHLAKALAQVGEKILAGASSAGFRLHVGGSSVELGRKLRRVAA